MAKYKITNDNKRAIVAALTEHNISYWELAEAMGVHENTVSKWMRRPNDEQAAKIKAAITSIVGK